MQSSNYRPEIDGLRAIAVGVVVLYHAGFSFLPGGFVGVDIFFVISGFLITGIIYRKLLNGDFSIVEFWERRVRRIIPALVVVLLFTVVGSLWLLFPDDYKRFSQTLSLQTVFASNFLFWTESGYFDEPAEFKPLLHTWSLAIEEQFYLLLPLLMLVLLRGGKLALISCLGLACLASLSLSMFWVAEAPNSAFYLLPARAWELLTGSMLVFYSHPIAQRILREALSIVGLGMIIFASTQFSSTTPFPGAAALLPCVGAALLILAHNGQQGTLLLTVLQSRPFVFTGLISYSLYLWHWPILVFFRYHWSEHLDVFAGTILVVASVLCAYLSYRFIETPVRQKKWLGSRSRLFGAALIAAFVLGGLGLIGHVSKGLPQRIDASVLNLYSGHQYTNPRRRECLFSERRSFVADEICQVGVQDDTRSASFIVIGDSHANSMMPLFDSEAKTRGLTGDYAVYNGCPPILATYRIDVGARHRCASFNRAMLGYIQASKASDIVLLGRWSFYALDRKLDRSLSNGERPGDWLQRPAPALEASKEIVAQGLRAFVDTIGRDKRIWIVRQVPAQGEQISARFLASQAWRGEQPEAYAITAHEHRQRQAYANSLIDQVSRPEHIGALDPTPFLCQNGSRCDLMRDGGSLYRDGDHISTFGLQFIAPMLEPFWRSVQGSAQQR